ncbi:3'-5' exonuclease [Limibacter armeniacum]|uniref:3'-5' exonuclease n=1 Tax=Limibacter armeniacum TaxID=466084 RepID=UPI002FE668A2
MYLFFDTETTGLPLNWKAPMTDLDNWPRIIQLAYASYDEGGNLLKKRVELIKPDGWIMPTGDFWIENGFSQEQSEELGLPILEVLQDFITQVEQNPYLIAHNMSYDYNVAGAELIRAKLFAKKKPVKICTKDESTDFCKLEGPYGYKWPKLEELHHILFEEGFDNAHDALADVEACARCFFELVRRGVINL